MCISRKEGTVFNILRLYWQNRFVKAREFLTLTIRSIDMATLYSPLYLPQEVVWS